MDRHIIPILSDMDRTVCYVLIDLSITIPGIVHPFWESLDVQQVIAYDVTKDDIL